MPPNNLDLSTRPTAYPTVVYRDNVTTVPIHPTILNDVIDELQETRTDETLTRSYLEQIIAEHQTDCVNGHDVLSFINHVETKTDGFLANYTDTCAYLIVDKHEVWGGEAEWMPWDDDDRYLLTTAYTREVLDIGKSDTASWAVEGLDISEQAGYIVPVKFPLRSVADESTIDTDPIELAQQAAALTDETVLHPTIAESLVLMEAIDQPHQQSIVTTAGILGIGVSEVEAMVHETGQTFERAQRTTERLGDFDSVQQLPESFYQ